LSELQNLNADEYYNAIFERYISLKSYKFIAKSKNKLIFTERSLEFLKHDDKEYYLGKILIMDKYKRTSRPDVFIESYRQFFLLSENEQQILTNSILHRCDDEIEEIDYTEINIWSKLHDNIKRGLEQGGYSNCENILRICDNSFRAIVIGLKDPISVSIEKLKKIFEELIQLKKTLSQVKIIQTKRVEIRDISTKIVKEKYRKEIDKITLIYELTEKNERNSIVENMLELEIEKIIRSKFSDYFPKLKIIDNHQHYFTKNGNYIDILAKSEQNEFTIIELKRDLLPQKALSQVLDYMNQIMDEYDTINVKGILLCKEVDNRVISAIESIKKLSKYPDCISVIKYDLLFNYKDSNITNFI
jgi:hypothetical protein